MILLNTIIPNGSFPRKVTLISKKTILINNILFKNGKTTVNKDKGKIKKLINGT